MLGEIHYINGIMLPEMHCVKRNTLPEIITLLDICYSTKITSQYWNYIMELHYQIYITLLETHYTNRIKLYFWNYVTLLE